MIFPNNGFQENQHKFIIIFLCSSASPTFLFIYPRAKKNNSQAPVQVSRNLCPKAMNSSDSQKPTSCLVILFLFSLLYHLPCASSQQELGSCLALFQCGIITAGFPFWGGNRPEHCGHPLLKLHCNQSNNSTSLFISDQEYYVLDIDQTSYTLTLARADLVGPFCASKFNTTTLPLDIFEILPTYKDLTFFYRCGSIVSYVSNHTCPNKGIVSVAQSSQSYCNGNFTVNVPQSFFPEEKFFSLNQFETVLRNGFKVKVTIDEIS